MLCFLSVLFFMAFLLAGCVKSKSVHYHVDEKINSPKVIAVEGPRKPWVAPIIQELRNRGFIVQRWGSQHRSIEKTASDKIEAYNEASTRYILYVDGSAYLDQMNRCFGGGYKFVYINADLVDVNTNEQ